MSKDSNGKISEISVAIGVTRALGKGTYEFARIDMTSRMTFEEPIELDSKEYKLAHRDLTRSVQAMVEKAEAEVIGGEDE